MKFYKILSITTAILLSLNSCNFSRENNTTNSNNINKKGFNTKSVSLSLPERENEKNRVRILRKTENVTSKISFHSRFPKNTKLSYKDVDLIPVVRTKSTHTALTKDEMIEKWKDWYKREKAFEESIETALEKIEDFNSFIDSLLGKESIKHIKDSKEFKEYSKEKNKEYNNDIPKNDEELKKCREELKDFSAWVKSKNSKLKNLPKDSDYLAGDFPKYDMDKTYDYYDSNDPTAYIVSNKYLDGVEYEDPNTQIVPISYFQNIKTTPMKKSFKTKGFKTKDVDPSEFDVDEPTPEPTIDPTPIPTPEPTPTIVDPTPTPIPTIDCVTPSYSVNSSSNETVDGVKTSILTIKANGVVDNKCIDSSVIFRLISPPNECHQQDIIEVKNYGLINAQQISIPNTIIRNGTWKVQTEITINGVTTTSEQSVEVLNVNSSTIKEIDNKAPSLITLHTSNTSGEPWDFEVDLEKGALDKSKNIFKASCIDSQEEDIYLEKKNFETGRYYIQNKLRNITNINSALNQPLEFNVINVKPTTFATKTTEPGTIDYSFYPSGGGTFKYNYTKGVLNTISTINVPSSLDIPLDNINQNTCSPKEKSEKLINSLLNSNDTPSDIKKLLFSVVNNDTNPNNSNAYSFDKLSNAPFESCNKQGFVVGTLINLTNSDFDANNYLLKSNLPDVHLNLNIVDYDNNNTIYRSFPFSAKVGQNTIVSFPWDGKDNNGVQIPTRDTNNKNYLLKVSLNSSFYASSISSNNMPIIYSPTAPSIDTNGTIIPIFDYTCSNDGLINDSNSSPDSCTCLSTQGFVVQGLSNCHDQNLCTSYCEPNSQPIFNNSVDLSPYYFPIAVYDDRMGPDLTFVFAPKEPVFKTISYIKILDGIENTKVSVKSNNGLVNSYNQDKKGCGKSCSETVSRKSSGIGNGVSYLMSNIVDESKLTKEQIDKQEINKFVRPLLNTYYSKNGIDNGNRSIVLSINLKKLWEAYMCNNKKTQEIVTIHIGDYINDPEIKFSIFLDKKNNKWNINIL